LCGPKVDDETVKTAKGFLEENPEIAKKYLEPGGIGRSSPAGYDGVGKNIVSRFLGKNWYIQRVARSLERLKLYKERRGSR
jgi:hypothetical protein